MKVERCAALPLITHDPYFSIWDVADTLYDADPQHWGGARQQLRGWLEVDGVRYRFLGDGALEQVVEQLQTELTATTTAFLFTAAGITLQVCFTSPLLAEDPELAARPVSYLRFTATGCAGRNVKVLLDVSADPVCMTYGDLSGGSFHTALTPYVCMGKATQHPLGNSGDRITADWGWLYLAGRAPGTRLIFDPEQRQLRAAMPLAEATEATLVVAMDDVASICYFGEMRRGLWTRRWATILQALDAALDDQTSTLSRCSALDEKIENAAEKLGDKAYALLCVMSYRLSFAAHKLIADENGEIIFLSKENDSNGCIGTVDVTYPSSPMYLLQNPELVKGMLRPVFRFAQYPVWEFDFAPHDVGRYPYAWGQVYGLSANSRFSNGAVYPAFYQYPADNDTYDFRWQMPVEESANMLILTAAVCLCDQKPDFALPYLESLKKWVRYLEQYGEDPGEQLCTDDFAGHLAHNANLSAKAIMGIEAFAQLCRLMQDPVAETYHAEAVAMAKSWAKRAAAGDHTRLVFDSADGWSLKYNLVWDKIFGSGLFEQNMLETDVDYYIAMENDYGTPLDSRETYTKSDWIMWSAALSDAPDKLKKLAAPVARFVLESADRVPFSDWYYTKTGKYVHFRGRSVQGGNYMPLLVKRGLGRKL